MDRLIQKGNARLAWAVVGLGLLWSCATPPTEPREPAAAASPKPVRPGGGGAGEIEGGQPAPPDSSRTGTVPPRRKKAPAPPKRVVMTPEMDEQLAPLLLSLLEREARIQYLEQKLDDAIRETVRSKAKLASQESRAEAASSLAEAEVALKTLVRSARGMNKRPEVVHLTDLMKASAAELKRQNYGGSLFLTNQIKGKLLDLQDLIDSEQQQRTAATTAFDTKIARLQALLSAKDAQIQKLQRKLDDTIQEAVRTKSKLRSQENKAEAASSLAEAETAVKVLGGPVSGPEGRADAVQIDALMKIGAEEFKKENYSGSLYATNQVKALVKDMKEHTQGLEQVTPVDGEVRFALPLTLKIVVPGKAREGPASESAVAWSVERGASPTAVSYKGAWIRVKGANDRWGWIYYNLVESP